MALPVILDAVVGAARQPLRDSRTAIGPDDSFRAIVLLLAVALIYPVAVCVAFYPTPYVDLREQINWGLVFPLSTWKHPPLQSWITGIVARTGARDAWFYMVAAQAMNIAAFAYIIRIGRDFIGNHVIAPFLLIGAGSFYLSAWLPTTALNADHIQAPIWAGILYHALAAGRNDRWRDWVLLGLLVGLAVLAKYFAAVIVAALAIAAIVLPEYRRIFVNGRFYAATLAGLAVAAPFVALTFGDGRAVDHGAYFFDPGATFLKRLEALSAFLLPFALLLLPLLIVAVAGRKEGGLSFVAPPATPPGRFLVAVSLAFLALMIGMIVFAGLMFRSRFSYPYLPIAALMALVVVRVNIPALMGLLRTMWVLWIALVIGTIGYAAFVLRDQMQDPAPMAARLLQTEWTAAHGCGPGYVMGEKLEAYAVSLYYGGARQPVIGLSFEDYDRANWADRDRIRRFGAIVVAASGEMARRLFLAEFPERTPVRRLELPYRRIGSSARHSYFYTFIPPKGC